jgi:hypothetical protein
MSTLTLHIGLPKTATTSLQEGLFSQHPGIFYLGKALGFKHGEYCRSEALYQALAPWLWQKGSGFNPDELQTAIKQAQETAAASAQCVVGSWESLSMASSEWEHALSKLSEVFTEVKLMITLREPLSWLTSFYLNDIRGHFIGRRRRFMDARAYMGFEEWLDVRRKDVGIDGFFSFYGQLRAAVDALGTANIGLFCYEQLCANPQRFFASLYEFLGVDPHVLPPQTNALHLNSRLTAAQYEAIQATQASWLRHAIWKLNPSKIGSHILKAQRKRE